MWFALQVLPVPAEFVFEIRQPAACNPIMISGRGLDLWSNVPVLGQLRVIGLVLRANKAARSAYAAMKKDPAYLQPLRWSDLQMQDSGEYG